MGQLDGLVYLTRYKSLFIPFSDELGETWIRDDRALVETRHAAT